MEGDMATSYVPSGTSLFQSTPSAWRETEIVPTLRLSKYISIHSLRMEGDVSFLLRFQSMCISIHSLRMEGDYKIVLNGTYGISISIHSLRMEGDKETFVSGARTRHFNPLPPHGGRPGAFSCATMTQNISIHSLRMEGDSCGKHLF